MKKVFIVGGGLAGLIASIQLIRAGIHCTVIERKSYPFHRVCGEYISNEAVPFLKKLDLFPGEFNPPILTRFQLSSVAGTNVILPLDLGGFGISRYAFDNFLYTKAKEQGVEFLLNTEVDNVTFSNDKFILKTSQHQYDADVVIGAFGKRSKLDLQFGRSFVSKRSPYVGVKYHIKRDNPSDLIALHNFRGGYCGISNVEDGRTNLCYLTHRDNLRRYGNVEQMEREVLFENPLLKSIFEESEFLFQKPEVINEISFETKLPVENHIIMVGDSAGMITPLCGNGMAMAIRSSKIAAEHIIKFCQHDAFTREAMETSYRKHWQQEFSSRLWFGRQVQRLFGSDVASNLTITLAIYSKPIAKAIIKNTHGPVF